ncbi:MFS family permease [Parvibaculum indicum]|uniref:MFS transporter n=1 Tax=Parvibaculum indicum TaxID=562969 RepID=UPI00141F2C05|nr:MFS transporter [Parvibaculum indicum]NIJ42967.1 MFS family permease [Parvibaculum indicum]
MSELRDNLYAWFVLLSFSLMFFLVTATTFTSLGVVLPDMVRDLGWDWTSAGLGFTLLGISCGLSSYPPALMIRHTNVRLTVLFGGAMMVAGFLCLYEVQTIWAYFLGTVLAGTGFSFVATVPGTYVIARCFKKQSMAFGIYYTLGGLGGIVGPLIYFTAVGVWDNWRMHWMIAAVLTGIAALIIAIFLREGEEQDKKAEEIANDAVVDAAPGVHMTKETWTVMQALRTPQFYIIAAAYVSFLLCGITVNSLSVAHLTEHGVAMALAGSLLSVEAFLNSVARAGSGFLGEFFEPKKLLFMSLMCLVVGMVALTLGTSFPILMVYAAGIGIGYGATFLATSVLLMNYFGRGPYLELFSMVNVAATLASFGPFFGGYVRDTTGSFVSAFLLFAIVPAVVGGAVLLMRPPVRSDEGEAAAEGQVEERGEEELRMEAVGSSS